MKGLALPMTHLDTKTSDTSQRGDTQSIQIADAFAAIKRIQSNLNTVILGKATEIDLLLACVLARGHALIEDLPGLGLDDCLPLQSGTNRRINWRTQQNPPPGKGFRIRIALTGTARLFALYLNTV